MVASAGTEKNRKESASSNARSSEVEHATWLVKAGERILGPFRTDEIVEKVRSHELAVIDEIAAPASRWRYLRDEPTFALVVEESRRSQLVTREDTEIQMGHMAGHDGLAGNDGTHGSTHHAQELMTLTPSHRMNLTALGVSPHDVQPQVKDAEFTEEVIRPGSATRPEDNIQKRRQFGVANDKQMASALKRNSNLIWLATIIAVIGIGTYLSRESTTVTPTGAKIDSQEAFKQALSEGEQAWNHGELEKASVAYKKADDLLPGTPDVVVRLSALSMKIDGQTVAAKRSFQDLLSKSADAGLQREAHLGLGLAAILSENFDEAKNEFNAVLKTTPNDVVVRYNLGVVSYLKGDMKEALSQLHQALQLDPHLGPVSLLTALAQIREGETHQQEASGVLESYLASHYDYRQESQALDSYLTVLRGNKMQAMAAAGVAVGSDPYLTSEHLHDPWLDLDVLSASKLLPYVQKLQSELNSPATQALLAIFQAKAKQTGEAEKTINDGLAQKPSDADLLAANAFVLMTSGRDADAKAALSLARKDGAKLAWILTGRNCQKLHELSCEKEAWDKLLTFEPPPVVALIGHAQLAFNEGAKDAAIVDLKRAESMSPQYLPAILLRERVSLP